MVIVFGILKVSILFVSVVLRSVSIQLKLLFWSRVVWFVWIYILSCCLSLVFCFLLIYENGLYFFFLVWMVIVQLFFLLLVVCSFCLGVLLFFFFIIFLYIFDQRFQLGFGGLIVFFFQSWFFFGRVILGLVIFLFLFLVEV